MASQRGHDPMAGLLSQLGGLEDVFQKPSMNAMKGRGLQQSPTSLQTVQKEAIPAASPSQRSPDFPTPPLTGSRNVVGPSTFQLSPSNVMAGSKGVAGNASAKKSDPFSLDSIPIGELGAGIRPMKSGGGDPSQKVAFGGHGSPDGRKLGAASPGFVNVAGFDDIFGTGGGSHSMPQSQTKPHAQYVGSGNPAGSPPQRPPHAVPAADDPFAVFQSPAQPARPAPAPARAPGPSYWEGQSDLLGGFEGTLGIVDHEPAGVAGSPDAFSSRRATAGSASNTSLAEEDWGSLTTASNASSPNPSPTKTQQVAAQPTRGEALKPIHSAPCIADPPPPPYDEAVHGNDYRRAASARRPASHGLGDSDEDEEVTSSSSWERRPNGLSAAKDDFRTGPSEGRAQRGSNNNLDVMAEGAKEQARAWLQTGQTWLKSASEKVSKVTKEAGVALQKGLGDLDSRFVQKGASAKKGGSDGLELPAYYYEWAAKISQLGPERQANTLAQLPEDDRLLVQRVLDQSAAQRAERSARRGATAGRAEDEDVLSSRGTGSPAQRWGQPAMERQLSNQSSTSVGGDDFRRPVSPPQPVPQPKPRPTPTTAPATEADLLGFTAGAQRGPSASVQYKRGSPSNTGSPPSVGATRVAPSDSGDHADLLGLGAKAAPLKASPSPSPGTSPAGARGGGATEVDLLGLGGKPGPAKVYASPGTSPSGARGGATEEEDLLGLHGQRGAPPPSGVHAPASASSPEDDILGAFTRPAAAPAKVPVAKSNIHTELEEVFGGGTPARTRPTDSMIDFGDEEDDLPAGHAHLYADAAAGEAAGNEPEIRRVLRERRLAEKHLRMRQKLAEKQARDEAENSEKAAKVELREQLKTKMEKWQAGKRDNIRALLSSLHTVLWEDSGWKAPGLTDLVEAGKVKRWYMKANLIVHPDKVKQKGGSVEQLVVADMAFDALKVAWGKFESMEMRA